MSELCPFCPIVRIKKLPHKFNLFHIFIGNEHKNLILENYSSTVFGVHVYSVRFENLKANVNVVVCEYCWCIKINSIQCEFQCFTIYLYFTCADNTLTLAIRSSPELNLERCFFLFLECVLFHRQNSSVEYM